MTVPQVWNRETGQLVQSSPEDLTSGLVSGKYALDADGGAVPLVGKDGKTYSTSPDKVAQALSTGAYSLMGHEGELRHDTIAKEKAKGFVGSLESGAESGVNQLLLGVPDAIMESDETPDQKIQREASEEYHKTARLLGGAVGVGGSLLFGGEFFKGAELAGQAVERAVLPAAEVAEAGLGRKLAATAASYATQGAVMSAPHALVDAAAGDPKKAAETLLWGIGAGAALGGAGELLSSGAKGLAGAAGRVLKSDGLSKFATDKTAQVFGADASELGDSASELTDFAHSEGLIKPGMSKADVADAVVKAKAKYGTQIQDVLDGLDKTLAGTTDAKVAGAALQPGELADRLTRALDSPELAMPLNRDKAKLLQDVIDSANKIPIQSSKGQGVVPFADANKFVDELHDRWISSLKSTDGSPMDSFRSSVYQVVRDAVHEAGDRVAVAANEPATIGALTRAKQAYSNLADLETLATQNEEQAAGSHFQNIADAFRAGHGPVGHAAQGIGAAIGGAIGGAPGAYIGSQVAKVPATILDYLARKWTQDKGLVTISALAHKAAKEGPEVFSAVMASEGAKRLTATMRVVKQTVQRLANDGIAQTDGASYEHMRHLLGSTQGLTPDQQHEKLSSRLTTLASNPAALAEVTSAMSAPFAAASPQLGQAYQEQLVSTINYLYDALPKSSTPPLPFSPDNWSPTAKDKLEFHDKASIVANPMSAMDHVEKGTLSDAHLHALQAVYPSIYGMMKSEILKFSAEHPDVMLPEAERQSISKFLGTPDPTSNPDRLRALQANYSSGGPKSDPTPGEKAPKGKIKDRPNSASAFSGTQGVQSS